MHSILREVLEPTLIEFWAIPGIQDILKAGLICLILYLPGKRIFNKLADYIRKHEGF